MASLITHPAVPLALGIALGRSVVPTGLLVIGALYAMLPDADGIAFTLRIPYESPYGHRGFSHSIVFAAAIAMLLMPWAAQLRIDRLTVFLFLFASALSHSILDACTNGGLGVEFLWPFSSERFFFPFRPIEVSPIAVDRFLSARGLSVLKSELVWIWFPLFALALIGYTSRNAATAPKNRATRSA